MYFIHCFNLYMYNLMGSHYVTIYYVACNQLTRALVDLRMVIYWPKHVVLSIVVLNTFDNKMLCLTVHNICWYSTQRYGKQQNQIQCVCYPRGVVQISIYYSHVFSHENVLRILFGSVFLSVLCISCYNLSMLIDILRILFQICFN